MKTASSLLASSRGRVSHGLVDVLIAGQTMLLFKKLLFQQHAQCMVDGKMPFLNVSCLFPRYAYRYLSKFCDFPATLTSQSNSTEPEGVGHLNRFYDTPGVARCANSDKNIARSSIAIYLLSIDNVSRCIIADSRDQRGLAR
jgi:hypothetical protein